MSSPTPEATNIKVTTNGSPYGTVVEINGKPAIDLVTLSVHLDANNPTGRVDLGFELPQMEFSGEMEVRSHCIHCLQSIPLPEAAS